MATYIGPSQLSCHQCGEVPLYMSKSGQGWFSSSLWSQAELRQLGSCPACGLQPGLLHTHMYIGYFVPKHAASPSGASNQFSPRQQTPDAAGGSLHCSVHFRQYV